MSEAIISDTINTRVQSQEMGRWEVCPIDRASSYPRFIQDEYVSGISFVTKILDLEFGQSRDIIILLLIFLHRKCSQCIKIYANSFVKDICSLSKYLGLGSLDNKHVKLDSRILTKIVYLRVQS